RVVGVIDRSGFVFDARGLPPQRLAALGAAKAKGVPLAKQPGGERGTAADAVRFIARHAIANPILVDVTADDTAETLAAAFAAGMHVVLANKRPITGERSKYEALKAAAQARGRHLLHEATVGAGLPIIDTYYKLVDSGDRVNKIEGCPSGTLGYLFGELARGRVLRYRAIVTRRRIRVGLVVVDASSPMASLNGTDNQFIFTTMRYKKNPLVITGPGAGPAVTAGGILNDVLKLAGA